MQFDQDGHSEVQRQLLITLVHGTWGRGFFPRLQRPNRRPFWFEDGSPFLARLSTELHDIPHKITPLLWSGANSIFVRDKTAHALAEHLATEHAEHPQATQLVIAHSHGGNIALRSLHHLQKRALCEADSPNPFIVTLATPFIEVQEANLGHWPTHLRNALFYAILFIPMAAQFYYFPSIESLPFKDVNELLRILSLYLPKLYAAILLGILCILLSESCFMAMPLLCTGTVSGLEGLPPDGLRSKR